MLQTCQSLPIEGYRIIFQKTIIWKHSSFLCYTVKKLDKENCLKQILHKFIHLQNLRYTRRTQFFILQKKPKQHRSILFLCIIYFKTWTIVKFLWKFVWDTPTENCYTLWMWLIRYYIFSVKQLSYLSLCTMHQLAVKQLGWQDGAFSLETLKFHQRWLPVRFMLDEMALEQVFSKEFLQTSPINHHSIIALYWSVTSSWSGSILSPPRSLSWGCHLWHQHFVGYRVRKF